MASQRGGHSRPPRDGNSSSGSASRRNDSVIRGLFRAIAAGLDLASIVAAFTLAAWVLPRCRPADLVAHSSWVADCIAVALAWQAGLSLLDLYSPRHWRRFIYAWPRAVFATITSTVAAVGLLELVTNLPDHVLYASLLGGQIHAVLASAHRAVLYRAIPPRAVERRLLLVGNAPGTAELREALRHPFDPLMKYIGAVPLGEDSVDDELMAPVFRIEDLERVIAQHGVTDLVLCHGKTVPESVARVLAESPFRGVRTPRLEDAYEDVTGKAAILYVKDDEWLAGVRWVETNLYATKVKRVLDVLASVALLPVALLLIAVCAIAVKLDSPGPVFYTQRRIGYQGRPFTLVKLRTMIDAPGRHRDQVEAQEDDPRPLPDDPRITRVGRILRAISLDELPQLLLVLRGEMSLVGPRPEQPHLVERYRAEIPLYNQRHFVRPGMTGWAQVRQSYSESVTDVVSKVQYDLYYISNLSVRLDVLILMETIGMVLTPKRRMARRRRQPGSPEQRDTTY